MKKKIYIAVLFLFSLCLLACSDKGEMVELSLADEENLNESESSDRGEITSSGLDNSDINTYNVQSDSSENNNSVNVSHTVYQEKSVTVYVCGAVVSPGVYKLMAGSRVVDGINAAGGMNPEAHEFYLNQAAMLSDGDKLYVPTKDEVINDTASGVDSGLNIDSGMSNDKGCTDAAMVNINSAGIDELMTLPGIGQSKASAIIEYRNSYGSFSSTEDIMNVGGIKEGMYNKIKDKICV